MQKRPTPASAPVGRAPAKQFLPAPPRPMGPTWEPKMTEQEKQELQQYIKDNDLPF